MFIDYIILLCFNPDVDVFKQQYLAENYHVQVVASEPGEECYYTKFDSLNLYH